MPDRVFLHRNYFSFCQFETCILFCYFFYFLKKQFPFFKKISISLILRKTKLINQSNLLLNQKNQYSVFMSKIIKIIKC